MLSALGTHKVIQGPTSSGQRFLPVLRDFQLTRQDFDPYLAIFSRFSAQNPSKRLELAQNKAGNGSSSLKIGGYHAISSWDPLLLTPKGPLAFRICPTRLESPIQGTMRGTCRNAPRWHKSDMSRAISHVSVKRVGLVPVLGPNSPGTVPYSVISPCPIVVLTPTAAHDLHE